jgi:hypothetical protein
MGKVWVKYESSMSKVDFFLKKVYPTARQHRSTA